MYYPRAPSPHYFAPHVPADPPRATEGGTAKPSPEPSPPGAATRTGVSAAGSRASSLSAPWLRPPPVEWTPWAPPPKYFLAGFYETARADVGAARDPRAAWQLRADVEGGGAPRPLALTAIRGTEGCFPTPGVTLAHGVTEETAHARWSLVLADDAFAQETAKRMVAVAVHIVLVDGLAASGQHVGLSMLCFDQYGSVGVVAPGEVGIGLEWATWFIAEGTRDEGGKDLIIFAGHNGYTTFTVLCANPAGPVLRPWEGWLDHELSVWSLWRPVNGFSVTRAPPWSASAAVSRAVSEASPARSASAVVRPTDVATGPPLANTAIATGVVSALTVTSEVDMPPA